MSRAKYQVHYKMQSFNLCLFYKFDITSVKLDHFVEAILDKEVRQSTKLFTTLLMENPSWQR